MDNAKRAAATAAADLVEDGMRLGLGTGSTVGHFLDALAARGLGIAGMPTSQDTERRCRQLGIRLLDPATTGELDLAVDGADELDRGLNLTKGGGGALLREKVVAAISERFIVTATPDKVVHRLADSFPLPVEVVPFALGPVTRRLRGLGFEVSERSSGSGEPYRTDNGNAVIDCQMPGGLEDPSATDIAIALLPGVAETGLFIDMAEQALLGRDDGTVEVVRAPRA